MKRIIIFVATIVLLFAMSNIVFANVHQQVDIESSPELEGPFAIICPDGTFSPITTNVKKFRNIVQKLELNYFNGSLTNYKYYDTEAKEYLFNPDITKGDISINSIVIFMSEKLNYTLPRSLPLYEDLEWIISQKIPMIGICIPVNNNISENEINSWEIVNFVAANCDVLIISEKIDIENKFSKIAEERGIPIYKAETFEKAGTILCQLFKEDVAEFINTNQITGRVTNELGQPVEGIEITATGTFGNNEYTFSDANGYYEFNCLYEDTYIINIESLEYGAYKKQALSLLFNTRINQCNFKVTHGRIITGLRFPVAVLPAGSSGASYVLMALFNSLNIAYDHQYYDSPNISPANMQKKEDLYEYNYESLSPYIADSYRASSYKTIIFTIGAASTLDYGYSSELTRLKAIIDWAKKNEITIIGFYVKQNIIYNDEKLFSQIIDLVAPECDMLLIVSDGKYEDRFYEIAVENDIPMQKIFKPKAAIPIFAEMFGTEEY